MKRLKSIIYTLAIAIGIVAPLAIASPAGAQDIEKNLQCGANLKFSMADGSCEVDNNGNTAAERIDQIVSQVINLLSLAVGVVAVIMIIVGGFKYITSGGDSGNVTGAKNTILYAVVGLIVVALAQVIVRFVVDRATLTGNTTGSATD